MVVLLKMLDFRCQFIAQILTLSVLRLDGTQFPLDCLQGSHQLLNHVALLRELLLVEFQFLTFDASAIGWALISVGPNSRLAIAVRRVPVFFEVAREGWSWIFGGVGGVLDFLGEILVD